MWQGYHLFRPRPHDRFLVDEVKPFVDAMRPDAFFFIRYNDPAPHIRLRLMSARDLDQEVLGVFPDAEIVAYEPEFERYGGPELMPVAERQFESSSRAVLAAMSRPDWSYEAALRTAIGMHLTLAEAFGLDAPKFFRSTTRRFLRLPGAPRDREAEARTLAEFDARFLEGFPASSEWIVEMRDVATQFGSSHLNAIQSFVHMTNNRLGIRYRDEAFIARMIVRSLE
jgi:thiopeptide-type bacteriocin biosynthesis protein